MRKADATPTAPRNRARVALISLIAAALLAACAATGPGGNAPPVEPRAGTWKTWVLASATEIRVPAPPDAAATAAEVALLQKLAAGRDAATLDRIRYWDAGSPAYRWNELAIETSARNNTTSVPGARAFTLMSVAIDDALVAAWNAKYAYNRPRPTDADSGVTAAVATPRSPSYPAEHAVVAGAASVVLGYIWPKDAERFAALAEQAAQSRVAAGVQYPSDTKAGLELGRAVGARVVEYAKTDGSGKKWTGTVPTGPGLWKGTNPGGVEEATFRTWLLASASELRPPPPPAPESAARAAEIAEVKNFKRTPQTTGLAYYWNYGQYGMPGTHLFWSRETSRKIYEQRLDANPPRAARLYALVQVAHYDATIASQDAKYAYWTARPTQFDPTITTVIPTPNFPTYPSNAAAFMLAPALVLAELFPQDAAHYNKIGEEFGATRLWAGIHFQSDIDAGYAIGRGVAKKAVARARADGAW
jgi:membrane-associated phospholipid phosphatase